MKKILQNTLIVLCILQFGVIILLRECSQGESKPCPETNDSVSDITQTIEIPGKEVEKPIPVFIHDTIHDTVFRTHEDTVKAVKDYSLLRSYKLPIVHDTNADIDFFATVQYNQIQKYHFEAKLYPKHTYELKQTFVKENQRVKVFAGLQSGISLIENKPILMPSIAILTKKEHLYMLTYEPFIKAPAIGCYWKIHISKPP